MNKIKNKILSSKVSRVVVSSSVVSTALIVSNTALASTGGVSSQVTSALTSTASDITSTLGAVAPIGLGIAGLFLAWKYGMKFFKGLSK